MYQRILFIGVVTLVLFSWTVSSHGAGLVNQERFLMTLGKKLGTYDGVDATACLKALKDAGIEPPEGWQLDRPMTDEDIMDLTDDLISAAELGKIRCTPRKAVDCVAETCREFGLRIGHIYLTFYGYIED